MRPSDRSRQFTLITRRQIENYAEDVARQFRPLKIYRFKTDSIEAATCPPRNS